MFVHQIEDDEGQRLSAHFLELCSLSTCEEVDQVVSHFSLVDQVGKHSLEGGRQGFAVAGVKNRLQDGKDASTDLFVLSHRALEDLDAHIDIFLEELSIDVLPLPQQHEVDS